jgi:hypothetical protein
LPTDTERLRDELRACLPSLVLERALAPSGQRVVYLARFDDAKIPDEVGRAEAEKARQVDVDDSDDQAFLWAGNRGDKSL